MKTKRVRKQQAGASPVEVPGVAANIPNPSDLAEAAKKEERVIAARDYSHVIDILRDEKRFSFQKIANWLNERGVPLDNNDVYRVYVSNIPSEQKQAMNALGEEIDPED